MVNSSLNNKHLLDPLTPDKDKYTNMSGLKFRKIVPDWTMANIVMPVFVTKLLITPSEARRKQNSNAFCRVAPPNFT